MSDLQIRLQAFKWLKDQSEIFVDYLPREILLNGFKLENNRVGLVGPRGIWKPQSMKLPISVTSILNGPYPDTYDTKSGIIDYKYYGTNPHHTDNVGLRRLMEEQIPLVYLFNIAKNKYIPIFPAYIVGDNPSALSFSIMADSVANMPNSNQSDSVDDPKIEYARRAYVTVTSLQRVHQKDFRNKVLTAYRNQCSLCRLRHVELLDAAHIIGDLEEHGDPIVQNGLSLCKIHHAAFDHNIIGVNPDYEVLVRKDVLEEIDGPMLKYGLQSLNKSKLILPAHRRDWPDRERLEKRFTSFVGAR